MKKIICILIGVFTFSISVYLFYWQNLPDLAANPDVITVEKINAISLCEVFTNADNYKSGQVRIRAFFALGGYYDVWSGMEITDFKNGCASSDSVKIIETEELKQIKKILFEKRKQYPMRDGWAIVEVELTGQIKETQTSNVSKTTVSRFEAVSFQEVSPISFIREKEASQYKNLELN